jgi:hypothetical protein
MINFNNYLTLVLSKDLFQQFLIIPLFQQLLIFNLKQFYSLGHFFPFSAAQTFASSVISFPLLV